MLSSDEMRAHGYLPTKRSLPAAASPSDGAATIANGRKPCGRKGAIRVLTTEKPLPPSEIPAACQRLMGLQRRRRFCIVQQSRVNRSTEAYIATEIGYRAPREKDANTEQRLADSKARKALFAKAAALRKAVEAGGGWKNSEDHDGTAAACAPIILAAKLGRDAWDTMRAEVEKDMVRSARSLPAFAWVDGVAGLGALGLGIIIGETGDLANYATKERVWKRLGLAVIDGDRQQRRTDAAAAARHGFAPKRRAEVWAITDSMFRHQWRGAKDDVPAHATGPFGQVYATRKAATDGRDWPPARRDADARRIMSKAMIEDLWRVWNGKAPIFQASEGLAA